MYKQGSIRKTSTCQVGIESIWFDTHLSNLCLFTLKSCKTHFRIFTEYICYGIWVLFLNWTLPISSHIIRTTTQDIAVQHKGLLKYYS